MGIEEILRLDRIRVIAIIILLVIFYSGIFANTYIGPQAPSVGWYVFTGLFLITLVYFVISIIATIYLKYRK
jgi:hypothetical protein